MTDTLIDLIRHGEPQGGSLYRGYTLNDPLSEKGWQQMWTAVGEYSQWQHIVSSPLSRCVEFSEKLAKKNNISFTTKDNLKEVGFGSWEGFTREQVKKKNLAEYNAFYSDPVNNRAEGFEDLNLFIDRVVSSYKEIVKSFENKHVLIVAHAGVIRAILAHVVCAPPNGLYNLKITNAGISRINASTNEIIFINSSV